MDVVRHRPPPNTQVAQPALRHRGKRLEPPEQPRALKVRRTGARLVQDGWAAQRGVVLQAPDTQLFDFVQHQSASLLTAPQLLQLLWCRPGEGRAGLHSLVIAHGPPPPYGAGLRPNGAACVSLACVNCAAHAGNTGKWGALAQGFCGQRNLAWKWSVHPHALMPDVGGATCIHCGLRVPCERMRAARLTNCPCHQLMEGEEEIMEGTILLRVVLALRACWHAWFRGADESTPPGTPGPSVSLGEVPALPPAIGAVQGAPRHPSPHCGGCRLRLLWKQAEGHSQVLRETGRRQMQRNVCGPCGWHSQGGAVQPTHGW